MHIHQLNVSHNERQDRLLLRVNTQTAHEFRFWLTRRLVLRLMPVLQQTVGRMESSTPQTVAPDTASQQILTELKRDAFLQKADFQTPYAEQTQQLPLGDEPMLVTEVQLQWQGDSVLLTLQDQGVAAGQHRSCQLKLQASLLHGLIHLLLQAMTSAEWPTMAAASEVLPAQTANAPPTTGYRH